MPRMRTIKPETFVSDTLSQVSVHARWSFAGLWTYADDEGRGRADARLIKAAIWALDDEITSHEVAAFLDELECERLICRYDFEGKQYLHIVNFSEHQRPNRPVPSKLPACQKETHGGLSEPSVRPHPERIQSSRTVGRSLDCADLGAALEVTVHIGHDADVFAGERALSEDSLSAHGVVSQISFTNTPTTTPLRTGDGVVDVVGMSEIGKSSTSLVTSEDDQDPPVEPEPQADPPLREDVERLCLHLADRIEANDCKRPTITKRWRDAARLLIDKDGRTEEQIHKAIDWCQDSEFWRSNVMSMPKLRDQYDRLRLQAVAEKTKGPRQSGFAAGSGARARVPSAEELENEEIVI